MFNNSTSIITNATLSLAYNTTAYSDNDNQLQPISVYAVTGGIFLLISMVVASSFRHCCCNHDSREGIGGYEKDFRYKKEENIRKNLEGEGKPDFPMDEENDNQIAPMHSLGSSPSLFSNNYVQEDGCGYNEVTCDDSLEEQLLVNQHRF